MDIIQFLKDYEIDYTEGPDKNVKAGWIGMNCPFCPDPSNHLGYNVDDDKGFRCWRCGWHKRDETIAELAGTGIQHARAILQKYEGKSDLATSQEKGRQKKPFRLPSFTGPFLPAHKKYLESRNFDPDRLQQEWNLKGTGPISSLDGIDYRLRILAPIYWMGQMVSFQGRDITGKSKTRYKACPVEYEIVEHQKILYTHPNRKPGGTGFIVEGFTDAWRIGINAAATFGIEYTWSQVKQICRMFERVFVLYDEGEQAQQQAENLVKDIRFRNIPAVNIPVKDDPASMSQEEADYLVKQLKNRRL